MQWKIRWIVLLLALNSADACAWNAIGHQVIGGIADRLIEGTPAQQHVRDILRAESLSTASVWADCAKGVDEQGSFRYVSSDRFPECQPFDTPEGREQMVDYVMRNDGRCTVLPGQETCHRQYHYADLDSSMSVYRPGVEGSSDHDIVSGIKAAVAVLAGKQAPDPFYIPSKVVALRLLVHWVGDLHQPLHVAAVHIDSAGQIVSAQEFLAESETRGGNLIRHDGRSLHAEWDEAPEGVVQPLFFEEAARAAGSNSLTPGPVESWPEIWASESARNSLRVFDGMQFMPRSCTANNRCVWEAHTPESYAERRVNLQHDAMIEAGVRLSQLLSALWPR